MDSGPRDITVFQASLERVLYMALKKALEHAHMTPCKQCEAKTNEWCVGVPWPHAARLRRGVRLAIQMHTKEFL